MKLNLDLSKVEVRESKTNVIPAGKYPAVIAEAEMLETKSGHALKLFFRVTEGEFAGSVVANFMNVVNSNADTMKYALSDLKKIATYIGHKNPNFITDTDELLNGRVGIVVAQREVQGEKENYKVSDIKGYFQYSEVGNAVPAATTSAPVTTEVKKEEAKMPWQK